MITRAAKKKSALQHAVRDAQRFSLRQRAAARRADMQGIEEGVDRISTLHLLNSKSCDDYRRGVLRGILPGAVRTSHHDWKAGAVDSDHCPFCQTLEPETVEHMFWRCPAWTDIRTQHSNCLFAFQAGWPQCFKCCGIMPANHQAFEHLALAVVEDPFGKDGSEDPSEKVEGDLAGKSRVGALN